VSPETLLFTKTHEWVRLETEPSGAQVAVVGVTAFALEALTDLVFIDLPAVGRRVRAGEPFGEVESVKAVSDLYSPVDGEIIEVNSSVADHLDRLAHDPYQTGWLVKIRITDDSNLNTLLDYNAYQKHCAEQAE